MAHPLFALLRELDQQRLWTVLDSTSPGIVMLTVTIADSRFEIDVFEDGQIEYAEYAGGEGTLPAAEALEQTLRRFGAVPRWALSREQ
ncbi:hypothetical protein [Labrys neptuniae]